MHETSKSILRYLHDSRFATRYFVGEGIDIGAGSDLLGQYIEMFPLMRSCRHWDRSDGDAEFLETLPDAAYDFAYSSHCLEHMVVVIPDEDMYEQGVFPSTWNHDHKWSFTTFKKQSWSPKSVNVTDLTTQFASAAHLVKMEQLDGTYRYLMNQRFDQTLTPVGECAIEFIMRKRTEQEKNQKGKFPPKSQ